MSLGDFCDNCNKHNTFFIQGNSVSYVMLADARRSPVTKEIEKRLKV